MVDQSIEYMPVACNLSKSVTYDDDDDSRSSESYDT